MQVKKFHEDIDLMSPVENKSDGSLESDSSPTASPRKQGGMMASFGRSLTVQTKNLNMMKADETSKSPSPRLKKQSTL